MDLNYKLIMNVSTSHGKLNCSKYIHCIAKFSEGNLSKTKDVRNMFPNILYGYLDQDNFLPKIYYFPKHLKIPLHKAEQYTITLLNSIVAIAILILSPV